MRSTISLNLSNSKSSGLSAACYRYSTTRSYVTCSRSKPKTFRQHRTHLAVCLVLDTGLRVSEMLTLRRDDLDFDNLILKVLGKGRKERLVPFSTELRKRLFRFDQLRAKKSIRSECV